MLTHDHNNARCFVKLADERSSRELILIGDIKWMALLEVPEPEEQVFLDIIEFPQING